MQNAGSLASVRVRPTVAAVAEDDNPTYFLPEDPGNLLHADPTRRSPVSSAVAN
jgi:hypothetical protein